MIEDITIRFYKILDNNPDSPIAIQFKQECERDPRQLQEWHDFLIEQYLSGNLNAVWKESINNIPQLKEQITFQQHVQRGIRQIHEQTIQAEVRRILPKRPLDNIKRSVQRRRFIVLAVSIAAIALLCIGVLVNRFWIGGDIEVEEGGIPVVMVEDFELDRVTEEMIVNGIPQRLPAKLSAIEGIYPVTHFAVNHAANRVAEDELMKVLDAAYRVSGRIRHAGEGLEIEASLVNVKKNKALWKEVFTIENNPKAFDDLQDEMSYMILSALHVNVSPQATVRLNMEISHDLDAVNFFLAGERAWAERTKASLEQSIDFFKKALQRDSSSAIINGYLALAYATYAENGFAGPGKDENWNLALSQADRTLKIDPQNPEALLVYGYHAYSIKKEFQQAEDFFSRVLNVQPGDARAHQAMAELHIRTGRMEEGRDHIQAARAIEPERNVIRWVETKYLTAFGRLEDARMAADDLMAMYPAYPNIKNFYWQYYLSKGLHQQALESIPSDREEDPKNYMRAIVYLDMDDARAFEETYNILPLVYKPTMDFLRLIRDDEFEAARAMLDQYGQQRQLEFIAISQTSDFAIFNKMKQDAGIRDILAKYGIKVHIIQKEVGPEI